MSTEQEELLLQEIDFEYQKLSMEAVPDALGLVLQLGLNIAIPILSGALLGERLDFELGTGRLFLGFMTGTGILISFFTAYSQIALLRKNR